jgi:hemoglobin
MAIKKDIADREDIHTLIRRFYEKVLQDKTIGIIFTEVFPIQWEHHIPLITDFWESLLLDKQQYKKNVMEIHLKMNATYPFTDEHFNAWLTLFNDTVDELFEGNIASLARKRANGIAGLMKYKMNNKNIV